MNVVFNNNSSTQGLSEEDIYKVVRRVRDWLLSNSAHLPSTPSRFVRAVRPLCSVCTTQTNLQKLLLFLHTQLVLHIDPVTKRVQYNPNLPTVAQSLLTGIGQHDNVLTCVELLAVSRILQYLLTQLHYGLPANLDSLTNACTQLSQVRTIVDPSVVLDRLVQIEFITLVPSSPSSSSSACSSSFRLSYKHAENMTDDRKRKESESDDSDEEAVATAEEGDDIFSAQPMHKWTRVSHACHELPLYQLPRDQMGQV